MVEHHPEMAARFPGSQIRDQKSESIAALSAFERELVHAIHSRQIFPVFQPITDEHQQVKGMEILSRWNRNGSVLAAGDFYRKYARNMPGWCSPRLSFRKRCRILISIPASVISP